MPTSDLLTAGHDRQRLDTVVSFDRRSRRPLILIIGYAAAAPVSLLPVSLNGDIRYEVGAQTTSPTGASGTFTHRPLLYRLMMAGVIRPAGEVTGRVGEFETVLRIEATLLCVVAGALLWFGVRRHHRESALPVAVAVTAALVLVNPRADAGARLAGRAHHRRRGRAWSGDGSTPGGRRRPLAGGGRCRQDRHPPHRTHRPDHPAPATCCPA